MKHEKQPSKLLSIIIPTKDRYPYLKILLRTLESFSCDEMEVILQDNTSDNKEFVEYLGTLNYNLDIRYFHTAEQIPISENSDRAVLNSSGKYLCFIGDDDGVMPSIIECVRWMDLENIDALKGAPVKYLWPDYICGKKNFTGSLTFKPFTYSVDWVDAYKELSRRAHKGFQGIGRMPSLYHGIVSRAKLDEVFARGGTYFPGPSPDMASAVSLSTLSLRYVIIDRSVVITGESRTVGGGSRTLKDRLSRLEDVPFLPPNTAAEWTSQIPKIWAGETIWAHSAIKALEYMHCSSILSEVNYERVLIRFATFHPRYRSMSRALTRHKFAFYLGVAWQSFLRYFRAGCRKIFFKKSFLGVPTIEVAVQKLSSFDKL